ncbi:hypothetical protein GEMRC1_000932 [Eukaryota sp. GEM-RC1]
MPNRSCTVCKAKVIADIAVCCDGFVCSHKCLKDWQTSSSTCDSCNAMPSSIVSAPDLVLEPVSSSLSCKDIPNPNHIHCQQTLLVLISSHIVRSLWKSDITRDRSLRWRLRHILPTIFQKVGYVSQRFFESAFLGVKLFLESNTLCAYPYDLFFLLPVKSYFQSRHTICFLENGTIFSY